MLLDFKLALHQSQIYFMLTKSEPFKGVLHHFGHRMPPQGKPGHVRPAQHLSSLLLARPPQRHGPRLCLFRVSQDLHERRQLEDELLFQRIIVPLAFTG